MEACYLRHSKVPVEEDLTHEFKAHRDLSDLDISVYKYTFGINGSWTPKCPRFRSTISKSICAMLNTGLKSTLYLGKSIISCIMFSKLVHLHFMNYFFQGVK